MGDDKILNEEQLSGTEKTTENQTPGEQGDITSINTPFLSKLRLNVKLFLLLRTVFFFFITILTALFIIIFFLFIVPILQENASVKKTEIANNKDFKKGADYKKQVGLLTKDIKRLTRKYNTYTSGISYIVINTTDNRFFLYKNKKLIREGFCSTGSLMMLKTEKGKAWVFKTPRGKRWIQGKITNPSWRRPDWSFIEEGSPVPSKDDPSRYESGVLGDYALGIGDGFLIHGTIYKRFLGMPVTHGCVRLNDEDLEVVYNTLNIGSKVYIF